MIRLVYRALLLLLPGPFRRRHGDDMEAVFLASIRRDLHGRGGRRRAITRLLREGLDLTRTSVALRRGHPQREPGGRKMGQYLELRDDVRQAVRSLLRRPLFALFAAGTVAVGIGSTTAIFSALETVVLNPLPYEGGDRMVGLWRAFGSGGDVLLSPSAEQVEAWSAQDDLFDGVEVIHTSYPILTGVGDAARVEVGLVRSSFFEFLGVRPIGGRLFTEHETVGDGAPVALVAHHLWKERLGGDTSALGRNLTLDGEILTVVGVLPAGMPLPNGISRRLDAYRPLPETRSLDGASVVARLQEGVATEDVRARMDLLAERAEADGGRAADWRGAVRRTAELVGGPVRENLRVLMAAVVLLLLIGCVNVSNLLLSRVTRREHEIAVRSALGAGRGRLVREQLLESLLLGLLGGGMGVGLAWGAIRGMASLRGGTLEVLGAVHINARVMAFALLASVASVVLFSVLPAVRVGWSAPSRGLGVGRRSAAGGRREGRARWALLVTEVALSFALLVGATLVLRSLAEMRSQDPGFNPEGLVAVRVSLPAWKYEGDQTSRPVHDRIEAAVERLPWVGRVVRASGVPPESGILVGSLEIEGGPEFEGNQLFYGSLVEPGFFGVLGQRIVDGRDFTEDDMRSGAPVLVLGESAARRLFPEREPVGGRVNQGGEWRTVVGVVEDAAHAGLSRPKPELQMYRTGDVQEGWLLARTTGATDEILPAIRGEILGVEPDAAILKLAPVDGMLSATLGRERFTTALLGVLAMLALFLSAVGLYGVVSQVVGQRTREIGIRMALGAAAGRVRTMVLGQGMIATAAGVALGTGLAVLGLRLLESRVFGLEGVTGGGAYVLAATVLSGVTLLACWVPAQRAASVQPSEALRRE